jgi:hypothetical protein
MKQDKLTNGYFRLLSHRGNLINGVNHNDLVLNIALLAMGYSMGILLPIAGILAFSGLLGRFDHNMAISKWDKSKGESAKYFMMGLVGMLVELSYVAIFILLVFKGVTMLYSK